MPERKATDQLPLFRKRREPLEARYRRWRLSEDGKAVFDRIEQEALELLRLGAQRIEINLLYAQVRAERRKSADNSYRAPIARDLISKHPLLEGVIRVKKRKSAA